LRIGDQPFAAAAADEIDQRGDLRPHAAAVELVLVVVALRFGEREPVDPALRGLVEVERHLLHARRQHQRIGAHAAGEKAGSEVLVDDRFDAAQVALLILNHRNASATAGDDHIARRGEVADRRGLDDRLRLRRGHDAAPSAPGILAHGPVVLRRELLRARFVHVRADRLRWIEERRVVAIDDGLRYHCDCLPSHGAPMELVAQPLYEHVADRALDVGARVIHRHRRNLVNRQLRAPQDEADLRPVAVGDHDVPSGLDHVGDVDRQRADHLVLVGDRLARAIADQSVAADRDDCEFARAHPFSLSASLPTRGSPA
jgi:hypothetical protein